MALSQNAQGFASALNDPNAKLGGSNGLWMDRADGWGARGTGWDDDGNPTYAAPEKDYSASNKAWEDSSFAKDGWAQIGNASAWAPGKWSNQSDLLEQWKGLYGAPAQDGSTIDLAYDPTFGYLSKGNSPGDPGGFGDFLKTVAPIGLSIFGGPMLSGMLGGGTLGAAGAGGLIGGASSALTGGNFLSGALKGAIGGGLGSAAGLGGAGGDMSGGWTSGGDLPTGDFNLGGAAAGASAGVSSNYWNMLAGDIPSGGMDLGLGDSGGGWTSGGDLSTGDFNLGASSNPTDTFQTNPFGPQGQTGAFPSIQGGIDQFSQPQANWGGPGMPDVSNLSPEWAKAILGTSVAANGGAGGGSIADTLKSFLTDPKNLLKGGSALANYLIQSRQADQLGDAANQAATRNQSLNQPQRLPYQQQLAQQLNDPSSFFQTNPVVQAMLERSKAQMEANSAKMGTSGRVFNDYLNSMNAGMSDTYYKNANLLSQLGGFSDGAGGAGSAYSQLAGQAASADANAFNGFSQFFNSQKEDPQIQQLKKQVQDKISEIFL